MKRILISLLALVLLLSPLLVSCKKDPVVDDPAPDDGGQTPPAEDTGYVLTENYMPSDVFAQMKTYLEGTGTGFFAYEDNNDIPNNAPYVSSDMFALSNCKVKSITIPVYSTGKADASGDFTFTIYILPNDATSLKAELNNPRDSFQIKINGEEYGLEEDKLIRKFIKVDLSQYGIALSDTQTLGFSHKDDTLFPARVRTKGYETIAGENVKYAPGKYMIDNWDVIGYYYYSHKIDSDTGNPVGFSYTDHSLFYDFELERTYESEDAYKAMIAEKAQADAEYAAKLAAVKAAYAGKSISLIGDSISTFNTITNDPALGLDDNPAYSKYTFSGGVYTYERTYWGRLASQTDMELCVINSWGGGKVYGWVNKYDGKDNMLLRSYNLANKVTGETPDVIFLNFGTNDMSGSPSSAQDPSSSAFTGYLPTGDLYQRLTDENKTKTDKEIVGEWFAEVKTRAENAGLNWDDPSTITFTGTKSNIYSSWEAAYALSLYNIQRLYGDAEIVCITLPDRNHSSSTQPRLSRANLLIRAMAEYFGTGFVNQDTSGVDRVNGLMYGCDGTGLHPSGRGHAALTKAIVEALYEKLPKN